MAEYVSPGSGGEENFAAWRREIERRLGNVERARTLTNASFTGRLRALDDDGVTQVMIGRVDEDPDRYGIDIAEGAITVGGGTVRAIDASSGSASWLNATIGTEASTYASFTLSRPSWATAAVVFSSVSFQLSNNSGGGYLQGCRVRTNGLGSATAEQSVADGETRVVAMSDSRSLTNVSTDIVVEGQAWVVPAPISTNFGAVSAVALWLR